MSNNAPCFHIYETVCFAGCLSHTLNAFNVCSHASVTCCSAFGAKDKAANCRKNKSRAAGGVIISFIRRLHNGSINGSTWLIDGNRRS
jgi:hypothetical protein